MKIAILGTGVVGQTLGTKLSALGHSVTMAGRDARNELAQGWARENGGRASDYAGAAAQADLVILATLGAASLTAADAAGAENLVGKVVIDVTNPLDLAQGFPPPMIADLSNTTSAGEALQAAHPRAHVVKALNTTGSELMVDPAQVPGPHDLFICGNDAKAKATAAELLGELGWTSLIDLGGIEAARGTEGLMLLWLRLYQHFGDARFNWHIAR